MDYLIIYCLIYICDQRKPLYDFYPVTRVEIGFVA